MANLQLSVEICSSGGGFPSDFQAFMSGPRVLTGTEYQRATVSGKLRMDMFNWGQFQRAEMQQKQWAHESKYLFII